MSEEDVNLIARPQGWQWLWSRPLLIVLFAHTIFSIGIWNARDGYQEETSNVSVALRVKKTHRLHVSVYDDLIALILNRVTPDPIAALTLVKYISSLLATVSLCLVMSCFSKFLRPGCVIFACLLWIASYLNAPVAQSTSLTLFTFGFFLLGLYGLLRKESVVALLLFYAIGLLAALMRPEYYISIALVTILAAVPMACKRLRPYFPRIGISPVRVTGIAAALAVIVAAVILVKPPKAIAAKIAALNQYALFSFAQCYSGYYHTKHLNEAFSPMTEYQSILNRQFGHPRTVFAAIGNNPAEAARYFIARGGKNLFVYAPKSLLGRYREQPGKNRHGWLYWAVCALLAAGIIAAIARLRQAAWLWNGFCRKLPRRLTTPDSNGRKILLLLTLLASSGVSVAMLIPTPRYFLPWIPLYCLGVAFCLDSLMKATRTTRFEGVILLVGCLVLCRPNYLAPRPNYVIDAVRQAASLVQSPPRVAAFWSAPYVVLGLTNNATGFLQGEEVRPSDIQRGRIDILLIDPAFRITSTWAAERAFFESFERNSQPFGFKKLDDPNTGDFTIYYRPKVN